MVVKALIIALAGAVATSAVTTQEMEPAPQQRNSFGRFAARLEASRREAASDASPQNAQMASSQANPLTDSHHNVQTSEECMPGEDAETCRKRKAAEAGLPDKPSDEPTWPPIKDQLVMLDKGGAVGTIVGLPDPEKQPRYQKFTVSFKGSLNTDKKYHLNQLKQYSGKWRPDEGDYVIQTGRSGHANYPILPGTFARVAEFAKIDGRGIEYLWLEYSNRERMKIKVMEVRKAVGDEPQRFAAAHAARQDPPLCCAPIHLNAGAVSDAEVEQLGKKCYTGLEASKFKPGDGSSKLYQGDQIILPTVYDIDALRQVISPLDKALVYADPSGTRVRRDDARVEALRNRPDADVVKIAKELLEEFDKLSDELKKGGLQPGKVKAREQRAKGLAEAAQSREAIEAENQIEIDDSYCADGHDGAGFITDCELKDRVRHSGNLRLSGWTTAVCHPRRACYKKERCDGVTTAFNRVYDGGLKSFHGDLTYLLFHPKSIRLFDERGFFIDILTGKGSSALLCRAGTKACNQIGPMVQYVVRSMNSFWKDELGLASFEPDPTDEPHEALDRQIAALGLPFIKNGLMRLHRTAGKHGRETFVWAGPVWGELEKLGVGHAPGGPWGPLEPLRFAELAVAAISLGGQLGYEIKGATMFCAYGADALAAMKDETFDVEAEERKARYAFADDWINDVLEKCRAGVDCPSITIYYRTQFASMCEIDDEYWPPAGVGFDLGVLEPKCFTNPQLVVNGLACPKLLVFLVKTADLAPGPGASRVGGHAVQHFLRSTRSSSSVLWAGQFEYSKNGGKRVTHRCPFPTKVAVAMEVDGEA